VSQRAHLWPARRLPPWLSVAEYPTTATAGATNVEAAALRLRIKCCARSDARRRSIGSAPRFAMHNPQAFVSAVYKRLDSSPTAAYVQPAQRQPASPPNGHQTIPPGWYPDQNDPTLRRYFDGQKWTSRTARTGQ
jgi:Protein of unknown function (DUF2510)